ncbi:MAG: hypothetical protein HYR85_06365 [Planctomycetes bacterium]|nr:hypothetical protein [Planctomycetota bacterium]MBI3843053.1 hypothetical protein [Planctomycetota bacterium]
MIAARLSVQASLLCFAVVFVIGALHHVPTLVVTSRAVIASVIGVAGGRFIGNRVEQIIADAEAAAPGEPKREEPR